MATDLQRLLAILVIGLGAVNPVGQVFAEQTDEPTEISDSGCVDVTVDGAQALSVTCLNQQLLTHPNANSSRTPMPTAAKTVVLRPSNQLGLFNRAATSVQMGNQFGHSAFPQRPVSEPLPSPLLDGR